MAMNMSMASMAGNQAAREVGQAIGKPMESMGVTNGRAPGHSEINWVDFNYPPGLRVIHYSADELPSSVSGMVRLFNLSYILTVLTCFLNFGDTIVLVLTTEAHAKWILQSALHLLLLPMAALGVFYSGYRGIAEPDATLAFRFKVGQPTLCVTYFFFTFVPFGCIHGLGQLGHVGEYTGDQGSTYWTIVILVESALWFLNFVLSCVNVIRASRFDGFGVGGPAGRL